MLCLTGWLILTGLGLLLLCWWLDLSEAHW